MNGQGRRPGRPIVAARPVSRLAILLLAAVLCGCQEPATPSPTAPPSPTPAAWHTPAPATVEALIGIDSEVRVYLLMIRPVTSDYAILYAREQPVGVLQALVQDLELIQPPPDMVEAHALLKEGYQLLVEGGTLLATYPRPATRSEAIFIQDWGVRQLREHRRVVASYLEQSQAAQQP